MRLYNQTKTRLAWAMGGTAYEAEPWGSVDLPDGLARAAQKLGVPLGEVPIPPEERAQVRIAEERAAADAAPLRALEARATKAEAAERAGRMRSQGRYWVLLPRDVPPRVVAGR